MVSDIEGLFKTYKRRNGPQVNKELVFKKILKAFNCDLSFI